MAGRFRGERVLAVIGATLLLVAASDALTYAATGSSLILGKINYANATTTVQNSGAGAAIKLVTKSPTSPAIITNAKGKVLNLYADRAASADVAVKATSATSATNATNATNSGKLGGKTLAQVQADALTTARAAIPQPNAQQVAMRQTWGMVQTGFVEPTQSISDGSHLFVVNSQSAAVTEINLSDGSVVRSFIADPTAASYPVAIAEDGTNLWIARSDSKVTVMNLSTAAVVTTLANGGGVPATVLNVPAALTYDGWHMWVANHGDGSVSEFDVSSFQQVRNVPVSPFPTVMVSDGSTLYVMGGSGNIDRVVEATGSLLSTWNVTQMTSAAFDGRYLWVGSSNQISVFDLDTGIATGIPANANLVLNSVTGLAYDGEHVWVVSSNNHTVYELDAQTGALVRKFAGGKYGFVNPDTVTVAGGHVWVTNYSGGSVTQLDLP
jgi:DNA-binding beta-propeller fold protein YncE